MNERLTAFPSDLDWTIALVVVTTLTMLLGPLLVENILGGTDTPTLLSARVANIIIALSLLVPGVSILWSYSRLTDDAVQVRQGLYFHAHIPYGNIKTAESVPAPSGTWVPGVRRVAGGQEVRVVFSSRNLVQITLRSPQRFVVFGFVPVGTAARVLLNVPNPDYVAALLIERSNEDNRRPPG